MWAGGVVRGVGWERCGGESQAPQHDAGGIEIEAAGSQDAAHLGLVEGKIQGRHGDAEARDASATSAAGHVVEARLDVEVMAAAGASTNGGAAAMVAVGLDVAAETDD